jgi:hypothetical protein
MDTASSRRRNIHLVVTWLLSRYLSLFLARLCNQETWRINITKIISTCAQVLMVWICLCGTDDIDMFMSSLLIIKLYYLLNKKEIFLLSSIDLSKERPVEMVTGDLTTMPMKVVDIVCSALWRMWREQRVIAFLCCSYYIVNKNRRQLQVQLIKRDWKHI